MAKPLRTPPANIESEKALLGSIMLRPDVMYDVNDVVQGGSFYVPKHQHIFDVMVSLSSKGEPIDLVSVSERLADRKLLEKSGGRSYLAELVNTVPSSSNAKHYAEIVQAKYLLRSLISCADFVADLGYSESEHIEDLLDQAEKRIYDITSSSGNRRFTAFSEMVDEAWERIDKLHNSKGEVRGVSSGYKELDDKLAGFQNSDLIILAARPSMGKTSLALDFARKTATEAKKSVGIFSLEMSRQQLVDRMLAADSRVDGWKLRTGRLTKDEEFSMIRESLDRLQHAPIFIDDQPANNILSMRSVARKLKRERGLDLIIVDYLQLMMLPANRIVDSMVLQVTEISRALKQLARELNVPVIALSQLSREIERRGGRPRLSDLRDSGSIEQDADVVMFIHREDKYRDDSEKPNIAEILIEKHRNGPTGKIELYFDESKATFLSIDDKHAGNFAEYAQAADSDLPF